MCYYIKLVNNNVLQIKMTTKDSIFCCSAHLLIDKNSENQHNLKNNH